MQCLIQEFMLYKFKLGHNASEATENICCMKGEGQLITAESTKLAYCCVEQQQWQTNQLRFLDS